MLWQWRICSIAKFTISHNSHNSNVHSKLTEINRFGENSYPIKKNKTKYNFQHHFSKHTPKIKIVSNFTWQFQWGMLFNWTIVNWWCIIGICLFVKLKLSQHPQIHLKCFSCRKRKLLSRCKRLWILRFHRTMSTFELIF